MTYNAIIQMGGTSSLSLGKFFHHTSRNSNGPRKAFDPISKGSFSNSLHLLYLGCLRTHQSSVFNSYQPAGGLTQKIGTAIFSFN